jgi:hypothetical protein
MKYIIFMLLSFSAYAADMLAETRYCGSPVRDINGTIHRSGKTLSAFQKIHPCPATGKTSGACPGWQINHTLPLACGGCDAVSNMQWLPNDIKTCSGAHCVDRFERKINAANPPYPDTANCVNVIVP